MKGNCNEPTKRDLSSTDVTTIGMEGNCNVYQATSSKSRGLTTI